MFIAKALIYLIVCHGGPADHFATFAENLKKEGYEVRIYATGPALKKFEERHIEVFHPFSLENKTEELAEKLAKECEKNSIVITDVGHPFDIALQKAFASYAPETVRIAYYDNPEAFVPGGYSEVALKVMREAEKVLFANAHLADDPHFDELSKKIERIGLGYFPMSHVEKIIKERATKREILLKKHGLDEKVLVYFGGNNDTYFDEAFPAFLQILEESAEQKDLSHLTILFQQHPGAKEKNRDGKLLQKWMQKQGGHSPKIIFSEVSTEEAQIIAEAALYYQTSLAPQLALAGIPTIQIGHKTYEDLLVRGHIGCTVVNASDFLKALAELETLSSVNKPLVLQRLGIHSDWLKILQRSLQ